MLGIDARALRVCWTVFLFVAVLAVVSLIRETLLHFALAIFFAYLLAPLVDLVERFLPKRRNLALAIVYVAILALLITVGINLGSRIAEEAGSLATRLPSMVAKWKLPQISIPWLDPYKDKVYLAAENEARELSSSAVPLLQKATGQILSGLGALIPIVLVPILAFFFLKDARAIASALIGTVSSGRRRGLLEEIILDIHGLLSKYIRALVILALASASAWFLFLQIVGTPYPLLLAGLCGVLEFIPVIGPAAGALTVMVVAAATSSGGLLWIILFFILFRMFQDYVLNPHLMSAGVEVPPLLVLFGVLAGEQIAGIPGMFFSVPTIAILKAVFTRLRQARLDPAAEGS